MIFDLVQLMKHRRLKTVGTTTLMVTTWSPWVRSVASANGRNVWTISCTTANSLVVSTRFSCEVLRNNSASLTWSMSVMAWSCRYTLFHLVSFDAGMDLPVPNFSSKAAWNNWLWWTKLVTFDTLPMAGRSTADDFCNPPRITNCKEWQKQRFEYPSHRKLLLNHLWINLPTAQHHQRAMRSNCLHPPQERSALLWACY